MIHRRLDGSLPCPHARPLPPPAQAGRRQPRWYPDAVRRVCLVPSGVGSPSGAILAALRSPHRPVEASSPAGCPPPLKMTPACTTGGVYPPTFKTDLWRGYGGVIGGVGVRACPPPEVLPPGAICGPLFGTVRIAPPRTPSRAAPDPHVCGRGGAQAALALAVERVAVPVVALGL